MTRADESEELMSISWLFSGMSLCSDSHRWRRTRKVMLYLRLREIRAMGLRVAGTCGINSLSLSLSICNPAILCCVKSKLWQDLILPPPSLPTLHALSILQWWWQIVFSFASLLCAVAYHVDWPVLPLLWQNKMKKPWHYYPTFKMCLHSHPCSDGFPELLKPHRVVSMSRRCTN